MSGETDKARLDPDDDEFYETMLNAMQAGTRDGLRDFVLRKALYRTSPEEIPVMLQHDVEEPAAEVEPDAADSFHPGAPRRPERLRSKGSALVEELWAEGIRDEILSDVGIGMLRRPVTLGVVNGYGNLSTRLAGMLDAVVINPKTDMAKHACRTVVLNEREASATKEFDTQAKIAEAVRGLLRDGNSVILACADNALPPGVAANVSWTHRAVDLRPRLSRVLSDLRREGFPLDLADGTHAEDAVAELSAPIPPERSRAAYGWLSGLAERGAATRRDIEDLARIAFTEILATPVIADGPRSFAAIKGLAPHVQERLEVLAERMRSPMDTPPGILLESPPGNGKTLIAGILAAESGRYFVQASVADWQGAGYLQDMLAAMRRTFEEARRNAPSILFLDELDSIGRRGTGDRNEQFWTLMINSFLEHLQGLGGRGDVAVVGATNNIHLIDPAVLRAGRFGEHIHVPNPTRAGRAAILADLLPAGLVAAIDIHALADRTGDCSPALLKALADETVLLANDRTPTPGDLERAFATMGRRVAGGYDPLRLRPLLSVGLCAQAVMAAAAYGEAVRVEGISVLPGLADLGRVSLAHRSGAFPQETALDITRFLHLQLAPSAGRLMISRAFARLGDPAALGMFSPLTAAEDARAEVSARQFVRSGATGKVYPMERSHEFELAVRAVLDRARGEVRSVLLRAKPAIIRAADVVSAKGSVAATEAAGLLGLPAYGEARSNPGMTLH